MRVTEITYLSSSHLPLLPLTFTIQPSTSASSCLSTPAMMPPLDPVSQILEIQFIQAWEFFEAEKFDQVSTYTSLLPHQPINLTPHQGQQPKRKAPTRTPPRPPPQSRPAHHPRALAQRFSLARRRSSPPLRGSVPGRNGADCRAGRGLQRTARRRESGAGYGARGGGRAGGSYGGGG